MMLKNGTYITMLRVGDFLRRALGSVPIIGYLAECNAQQHSDSIKEFFFGVVFATSTFWLSALLFLGFRANEHVSYLTLLRSTVSGGELFIFSVGFLGPVVLTALDDPKHARPFPGKAWHTICLIALMVVSATFFGLIKVATTAQLVPLLNYEFLVQASMWIAGSAMVLRYLTIVYRKQTLANPEKKMKATEVDFAKRFVAQHGGERGQE